MLRLALVCSVAGSTLAVGDRGGAVVKALIPNWLNDFDYAAKSDGDDDDNKEESNDDDERFNSHGNLIVTKSSRMSGDDVKAMVSGIMKSSKDRWADLSSGKKDAGNSMRLGNLIDLWWYEQTFPHKRRGYDVGKQKMNTMGMQFTGEQWSREILESIDLQCKHSKKCFGRYLLQKASKIRNATYHHEKDHGRDRAVRLHAERSPKLQYLQTIMTSRYGIYQPQTVRDYMLPEMHNDLSHAFKTYATQHDRKLLNAPEADAVVHFRLGDALNNEPSIHPASIAKALASLNPKPKTIEVLDGGFSFKPDKPGNTKLSVWLLKLLSDEILTVLPDAKIFMPTAKSVRSASVDEDWAKLVNAKMMVAGAGSFGLSAAIARNHSDPAKQTRTPAYWHGVFPCTAEHYEVDEVWQRKNMPKTKEQVENWNLAASIKDADKSTQQPESDHEMHQSGRWRMFNYECSCAADDGSQVQKFDPTDLRPKKACKHLNTMAELKAKPPESKKGGDDDSSDDDDA